MIWIRTEDGEYQMIPEEIWVKRQKNGILVRTPRRFGAEGVSDGAQTWSLGPLRGYPLARIITRAEYEEHRQGREERL